MSSLNDIESHSTLRQPSFESRYLHLHRRIRPILITSSLAFLIFLALSYHATTSDRAPWAHHAPPLPFDSEFDSEPEPDFGFSHDDPRHHAIKEMLRKLEIPPDTPDPSTLIHYDRILPDVNVDDLPEPSYRPFPMDQYSTLYETPTSEPLIPDNLRTPYFHNYELPSDAFVLNWTSPEWFDPQGGPLREEMPRVQFDFKGKGARKESGLERTLREGRKEAVKRGFVWAWGRYKERAWGMSPASHYITNLRDQTNR